MLGYNLTLEKENTQIYIIYISKRKLYDEIRNSETVRCLIL